MVLHILGIIGKILGFTLLGVLGLVLVVLLIVLFVPVGADIAYEGGQFRLSAKVCGILLQLLPRKREKKKKEKKPKKPKKPKEPKKSTGQPAEGEPKKKKKLSFTKEELFEILQRVLRGLGKFGKLHVDRFLLHYVAGGKDPYDTAVTFAYVNAAISSLAPVCGEKFIVKDYDIQTDIDFTADKMQVDFGLCITLRLWQFVHAGLAAANGAIAVLIKSKLRQFREKRQAKKEAKHQEKLDKINNSSNQAEERNDNNG